MAVIETRTLTKIHKNEHIALTGEEYFSPLYIVDNMPSIIQGDDAMVEMLRTLSGFGITSVKGLDYLVFRPNQLSTDSADRVARPANPVCAAMQSGPLPLYDWDRHSARECTRTILRPPPEISRARR